MSRNSGLCLYIDKGDYLENSNHVSTVIYPML